MQKKSIFWRFLIICFVGLFLISGTFYSGTAFCQVEPEEEEEEMLQTRPRPDVRPNPMLEGAAGMKPAATMQQMRPAMPAQQMRPAMPAQQMRPAMPAQQMRPAMPAQQMRPALPIHE